MMDMLEVAKKVIDYYKKYGKIEHQTYIKEIIAFYDNDDELNEAESNLIGDKYNNDKLCLNLKSGGIQPGYSEETRQKISNALTGRYISEQTREKLSISHKGKQPWLGRHHSQGTIEKMKISQRKSEETKLKISESLKGRHLTDEHKLNIKSGSKHTKPNIGKHWMHLDNINKLINNNLIDEYIANGWKLGRNDCKPLTEEHKRKISNALKGEKNPFYGKQHSQGTIEKMRQAKSGKHWIIDPETNKRKLI